MLTRLSLFQAYAVTLSSYARIVTLVHPLSALYIHCPYVKAPGPMGNFDLD